MSVQHFRVLSNTFTLILNWFSIQKVFQQYLLEIYHVSLDLNLKLPATSGSVNQQIRKLRSAEKQLEIIEEKVFMTFGTGSNQSTRQAYQTLTGLIDEMTWLSIHLKLLAEESLIDPYGTVALLYRTRAKVSHLLFRLHRLKAEQLLTARSF